MTLTPGKQYLIYGSGQATMLLTIRDQKDAQRLQMLQQKPNIQFRLRKEKTMNNNNR